MHRKGFLGILGTGGIKPAVVPEKGRYKPAVSPYQLYSSPGCRAHSLSASPSGPSHADPCQEGRNRPAWSRHLAASSQTSLAPVAMAEVRRAATTHIPSLIQGSSLRKLSLRTLFPLFLWWDFPCFFPTARPSLVLPSGASRNSNRTSSPRSRMPVRKTRSNSHPFLRRQDCGKENFNDYTASLARPFRRRFRRTRLPVGELDRARKPNFLFRGLLWG